MADWSKVPVEEVRPGNTVEVDDVIAQVMSVRVTDKGRNLGQVELYLRNHGPRYITPGAEIDVFR